MSLRHITSTGLSQMAVLCTLLVFWSQTAVTAFQTHFTLQHCMQLFSGSSIAHHCTPLESHMTNQSMPPSHSVVRFMMLLMNQPLFGMTHQLILTQRALHFSSHWRTAPRNTTYSLQMVSAWNLRLQNCTWVWLEAIFANVRVSHTDECNLPPFLPGKLLRPQVFMLVSELGCHLG